MRTLLSRRPPRRDVPIERKLRRTPQVEDIERAVCRALGVPKESLVARANHGNDARSMAVFLCRKLTDTSLADLAPRFGGISPGAVSKIAVRFEAQLRSDRKFARKAAKIEKHIMHQMSNVET